MNTKCGQHFNYWIDYFSDRPGLWLVRDMESNLIWRNNRWLKMVNQREPILPSPENLRRVMSPEDGRRANDLMSLALKTGKVVSDVMPVRMSDGAERDFAMAWKISICKGCQNRCRVAEIRLCPVPVCVPQFCGQLR